jgi:hypothetical protein
MLKLVENAKLVQGEYQRTMTALYTKVKWIKLLSVDTAWNKTELKPEREEQVYEYDISWSAIACIIVWGESTHEKETVWG